MVAAPRLIALGFCAAESANQLLVVGDGVDTLVVLEWSESMMLDAQRKVLGVVFDMFLVVAFSACMVVREF